MRCPRRVCPRQNPMTQERDEPPTGEPRTEEGVAPPSGSTPKGAAFEKKHVLDTADRRDSDCQSPTLSTDESDAHPADAGRATEWKCPWSSVCEGSSTPNGTGCRAKGPASSGALAWTLERPHERDATGVTKSDLIWMREVPVAVSWFDGLARRSAGKGTNALSRRNFLADAALVGGTATAVLPGTAASAAACPAGQTLCHHVCVNEKTGPKNCGSCGHVCRSKDVCAKGKCEPCAVGTTNCNITCVNLQTDDLNCGVCDAVCPSCRTAVDASVVAAEPGGRCVWTLNVDGATCDDWQLAFTSRPTRKR
jgi:hypothetical protein